MTQKTQKNPLFSVFSKPIQNTTPFATPYSLRDVYELITGSEYYHVTKHLRSIANLKEAKKYKAANFDYAAFSGTFTKRGAGNLITHSGIMVLDFDHLPDVEATKQLLLGDEYFATKLLFRSPSGDGLKWVIAADYVAEKGKNIPVDCSKYQTEYFTAVSNYLRTEYGLQTDQSGKDTSRACFLCHDPQAVLPEERETKLFDVEFWLRYGEPAAPVATPLKPADQEEADFHKVLERIEQSYADIAFDYEDWLALGFTLVSRFGESGRDYYHRLSRFCSKYNEKDTNTQYSACLKNPRNDSDLTTFFGLAKKAGIDIAVNKGTRPIVPSIKKSQPAPKACEWHGLQELQELYSKNEDCKLPEVVICSSPEIAAIVEQYGHCAVHCAGVVQSLTANEKSILRKCAEVVYYFAESEENRRSVAKKMTDCRTVTLPEKFAATEEYNPVNKLFNGAMPYQFYDFSENEKGKGKYHIRPLWLVNFLTINDFCIIGEEKDKNVYARIQRNIVKKVSVGEITQFAFDYLSSHNQTVCELYVKLGNKEQLIFGFLP
ncbi:MAG: PriCT-2 domain-containing protein [Bacteroidales bacterium]|jgi:hypothetical protein|nr:PriCT-2 domain-containing protein [Bacteroidales bacterium]